MQWWRKVAICHFPYHLVALSYHETIQMQNNCPRHSSVTSGLEWVCTAIIRLEVVTKAIGTMHETVHLADNSRFIQQVSVQESISQVSITKPSETQNETSLPSSDLESSQRKLSPLMKCSFGWPQIGWNHCKIIQTATAASWSKKILKYTHIQQFHTQTPQNYMKHPFNVTKAQESPQKVESWN